MIFKAGDQISIVKLIVDIKIYIDKTIMFVQSIINDDEWYWLHEVT